MHIHALPWCSSPASLHRSVDHCPSLSGSALYERCDVLGVVTQMLSDQSAGTNSVPLDESNQQGFVFRVHLITIRWIVLSDAHRDVAGRHLAQLLDDLEQPVTPGGRVDSPME